MWPSYAWSAATKTTSYLQYGHGDSGKIEAFNVPEAVVWRVPVPHIVIPVPARIVSPFRKVRRSYPPMPPVMTPRPGSCGITFLPVPIVVWSRRRGAAPPAPLICVPAVIEPVIPRSESRRGGGVLPPRPRRRRGSTTAWWHAVTLSEKLFNKKKDVQVNVSRHVSKVWESQR